MWTTVVCHSALKDCGHIPAGLGPAVCLHLPWHLICTPLYGIYKYPTSWHTGRHHISFFGKCKAKSWSLSSHCLSVPVDCMDCLGCNAIQQTCNFPLQEIKTASKAGQVFADSESATEKYQTLLFRVGQTMLSQQYGEGPLLCKLAIFLFFFVLFADRCLNLQINFIKIEK